MVQNFSREMAKRGHQVEIITTPKYAGADSSPLFRQLNQIVPTTFVSENAFSNFCGPLSRTIGSAIERADIVHLHTLWHLLNVFASMKCARSGKPYVLMPHGMLDPYSLSVKRWRKSIYLRTVERNVISAAARIVYTTDEEANLAEAQLTFLPKRAVVPLGGGAPPDEAVGFTSVFYDRFPLARERRQLLFLGRLHEKKGLDRILAVLPAIVEKFPDALLTVVGEGAPRFEAFLKNSIAAHKLQKHVLMTGHLEGPMKWGAYASAEVFLLPSRQENFAITVAEAMQMGLPVIISNKVNTWPYVKDADAGVVLDDRTIIPDLRDSIIRLMQNPNELKLKSERGKRYSRANLTWDAAVTKMLECYSEVLSSSHSCLLK